MNDIIKSLVQFVIKDLWPLIKPLLIRLIVRLIDKTFNHVSDIFNEFNSDIKKDKTEFTTYAKKKVKETDIKHKEYSKVAKKAVDLDEIEYFKTEANIAKGESQAWREIVLMVEKNRTGDESHKLANDRLKTLKNEIIKESKEEIKGIDLNEIFERNLLGTGSIKLGEITKGEDTAGDK
ncbi:MAG: hypothetical protein PHE26_05355 [Syntrophomonadaceae bacterium]|nr:hypothetical protein [Syntrophomonadaceae bacterium]